MDIKNRIERLDEAQQQRPALAIPIATVKKFSEDKSTNLASMMAFWAFFSIFPLFLAGITLLSWFVPERDRERVLEQVAGYFPLLDVSTIGALTGSVVALTFGLVAAIWSGSAVVRVTQDAFNAVWEVPLVERPKLGEQIKRSILVMGTIGVGLVASTLTIGFISGDNPAIDLGPLSMLLGYALAIALDIGLFIVAFRMLTDRLISTRDVLPGAVFAGVAFWILQTISSIIITRHLSSAQETYGNFATVITILWWFYLQAQLTLLGAQVNVVLKRHYWPRGLVNAPETEADHRILADYAKERTHVKGEDVSVRLPGLPNVAATEDVQAEPGDGEADADGSGGRRQRSQRPRAESADPEELSVAELVKEASEGTARLVRAELKMAALELQTKGKSAARGAGLIAAAGVVALYGLGAFVVSLILVLALAFGAWATAGIVALTLFGVGAGLAVGGKKQVREVGPLPPELTIDQIKTDIAVMKDALAKEKAHR